MAFAAVLGALAVETIPQQGLHAPATLVGIVLVALVGTLLPVPMAFDVVIAYVAMSRGVALPYVVTILCTLGIYSVYSFLVVGKTISWKIAAAAAGGVAALGMLAGVAALGLG
jgi:ABC-type transport system involved in Fe-S cluster assembly fused permease/ATPase subunit